MARPRRPFRVLALDGGGIRGVFSARILALAEQRLGQPLRTRFDLVAGTSTGSIIAAAVAAGVPVAEVVVLYRQHGRHIFRRRWRGLGGWLASKYSSRHLAKLLDDTFGGLRLRDLMQPPLLIPAADIERGCVHVLKSPYFPEARRDLDVRVADAVLASCAAPTFFDPHTIDGHHLTDGGVWANNPSTLAVTDAVRRFGRLPSDVFLLNVGTGDEDVKFSRAGAWWGVLTGWQRRKLLRLILSLQTKSAANSAMLLLPPGQFLRLSFSTDSVLPLDAIAAVEDLVARADDVFAAYEPALMQFFNHTEVEEA
jgi:patatin-like phospholipase/acyl hydrolase